MLIPQQLSSDVRYLSDSDFTALFRIDEMTLSIQELERMCPTGRLLLYTENRLTNKTVELLADLKLSEVHFLILEELPSLELLRQLRFQEIKVGVCFPADWPTACRWFPWHNFKPDLQLDMLRKLYTFGLQPFVAANPILIRDQVNYAELVAPFTGELLMLDQQYSELAIQLRSIFQAARNKHLN
jgi:hypothetical protein